jgi:hypothetical protein
MQGFRQKQALRLMMTGNLLARFSAANSTALAKVDEYRGRGAMVHSVSADRVVLALQGLLIEIDASGRVSQRKA